MQNAHIAASGEIVGAQHGAHINPNLSKMGKQIIACRILAHSRQKYNRLLKARQILGHIAGDAAKGRAHFSRHSNAGLKTGSGAGNGVYRGAPNGYHRAFRISRFPINHLPAPRNAQHCYAECWRRKSPPAPRSGECSTLRGKRSLKISSAFFKRSRSSAESETSIAR